MGLRKSHILRSKKIRVGITLGDPSGVGPQIIAKALSRPSISSLAEFTVIGDKWVFDKAGGGKRKTQNFKLIDLDNVSHKNFSFGGIRAEHGKASIEYIDKAIELIKNNQIDCLVTSPISKEAVKLAGFRWTGHSEYLAHLTRRDDFVMMLANKYMRVSLVTRHIPLSKVSTQLNKNKIYKTIILTYVSLKKLFDIKEPHIVVCGLNPHASDGGLIGREEIDIIIPAINMAKKKIIYIDGPLPSDTVFLKSKYKAYDAAIAMYHDQALIPLKILDFDSGVNITLGLPFVRTSPLHGTAFDIAKKNSAKPDPLIAAIKFAIRCTLNLKRA